MGGNSFTFKHFAVDQTDCAMKVGTDGVLLGAWCRLRPGIDKVLLDIGTGTGLIALQLAQRTAGWGAEIEAVEIDTLSAARAKENFYTSKWANRLMVNAKSLQKFVAETSRKFDHIVSNPPFFIDSLQAPNPARSKARHATELTYEELILLSIKILNPQIGTVSLIVPAGAETEKILRLATREHLETTRLTEVHSTHKSGPKRTLIEFSRQIAPTHQLQQAPAFSTPEKLTIQDADGTFSEEYRTLTRDFYLKF